VNDETTLAVPSSPLSLPPAAVALRFDFLVLYHRGMTFKAMGDRYKDQGITIRDISLAIETADEKDHAKARKMAEHMPRMALDRLKGAAPGAAETLIEICKDGERESERVRSAQLILESSEVLHKVTPPAKEELPTLTQADIDAWNASFKTLGNVIDADEEKSELPPRTLD